MSLASRRFALLWGAAVGVAAIVLAPSAPSAAADPDIDSESAAAVINELREQGYAVEVNGVPSGDTALLTTCTVTAIHNPGDPSADPTSTMTISVDVACPIQHG